MRLLTCARTAAAAPSRCAEYVLIITDLQCAPGLCNAAHCWLRALTHALRSMPLMDGLTAATKIMAALGAAAPPIVALSAACSPEEKQRCTDAGITMHLSKPMRLEQMGILRELVQSW